VQQERARTSDIFLAVVFWVRVPLSQAVKEVTLHCSKSPQRGGWVKSLDMLTYMLEYILA